ncbi:hypothetical protein Tco_0862037 [Tanacetum coccineum]
MSFSLPLQPHDKHKHPSLTPHLQQSKNRLAILWGFIGRIQSKDKIEGIGLQGKFYGSDEVFEASHQTNTANTRWAAYKKERRQRLKGAIVNTFHVSNLKKCLADANLHVPLDEIKVDETLRFVREHVEIMDREVKSLKRSKIPIVKVRWNSKRGPEFTWEREDHMKAKYPRLFADCSVEPSR